jgi:hypothetical protein
VDNDPGDIDTAFPQHVEGRDAEMAGADEGYPHGAICPGSVGHVDSTAAAYVSLRE